MIYIKGHMFEGGHKRVFTRNTNLEDLSSNGNIMVLRMILFTALVTVLRNGGNTRLVWAVDEIGALDRSNISSLLHMLEANGISLLTAAPNIEDRAKGGFAHHMRINEGALYNIFAKDSGIRERNADGDLIYPPKTPDAETEEVGQ